MTDSPIYSEFNYFLAKVPTHYRRVEGSMGVFERDAFTSLFPEQHARVHGMVVFMQYLLRRGDPLTMESQVGVGLYRPMVAPM